jgi:hypothetical protein
MEEIKAEIDKMIRSLANHKSAGQEKTRTYLGDVLLLRAAVSVTLETLSAAEKQELKLHWGTLAPVLRNFMEEHDRVKDGHMRAAILNQLFD